MTEYTRECLVAAAFFLYLWGCVVGVAFQSLTTFYVFAAAGVALALVAGLAPKPPKG